jgi:hypothetical protein
MSKVIDLVNIESHFGSAWISDIKNSNGEFYRIKFRHSATYMFSKGVSGFLERFDYAYTSEIESIEKINEKEFAKIFDCSTAKNN